MNQPAPPAPGLTTGQIALHFRVPEWQVVRLFTRKFLPEPARFQRARVIPEGSLPAVREALVRAGYLKPDQVPAREPAQQI